VTTDVDSAEGLNAAFAVASAIKKGPVLIERQVPGDVYRIMVARGRTASIVRRSPRTITGDGRRTVRELIEDANRAIASKCVAAPHLGTVPLDDETRNQLRLQGFELDDVVPPDVAVRLRRIPLLSTGGVYEDVTKEAHPDIRRMAEMLASSFGLEMCGIDFVSRDISRSCAVEGVVLELNATPGLRIPYAAGMSAAEIGMLVLGPAPGRIPITLIIASQADLRSFRAAIRFAEEDGWVIGRACGLGSMPLGSSDAEPGSPARPSLPELVERLLRNPLAGSLTIVSTPEDVSRSGLPVDHYDLVVLCSRALGGNWQTVLSKRATDYFGASGPDEALAHPALRRLRAGSG
jgi:cyanophycin synthetase